MKRNLVREQIQTYGSEDAVIEAAIELLRSRLAKPKDAMLSPAAVRDYLRLNLAPLQYEAFWVVFLNAQNQVIAAEEMFRGTLSQTSVYPREVVKRALSHNAAAILLAHNHPSGTPEPSHADEALTRCLKNACALIDVKVLDHFIVTAAKVTSFAECGLI
jgi:DNA repair protein RadC